MRTYLEYYQEEICPSIATLDVFLKTKEEPYAHVDVAKVLCITTDELQAVLDEQKFAIITKGVLFLLLEKIQLPFCQMICKEMEHLQDALYSVAEIAYIYGVSESLVAKAVETAKMTTEQFTYDEIKKILEHIYI